MKLKASLVALTALLCPVFVGVAIAIPMDIPSGVYNVLDHPGGNAGGDYILRLDDLLIGCDPCTFSADTAAGVTMAYDSVTGDTHISGTVSGNQAGNTGFWILDFLYPGMLSQPVDVAGDLGDWQDIAYQSQDLVNGGIGFATGTLTQGGTMFDLTDYTSGNYTPNTFFLGDDDNLGYGHRLQNHGPFHTDTNWDSFGFSDKNYISGWGWLAVNGGRYDTQDFLFLATPVPEPTSFTLFFTGAVVLGLARRRKKRRQQSDG